MTAGMRALLIVAHPDDETFGCGSLLRHLVVGGAHTVVSCLTRGEAGEVEPGVEAPDGVAALRAAELRAAAALLGVDEVELLGFEDSGMSGDPGPATLCGSAPDVLAGAVADAVARHRPDVVITLDGGDGHRDHQRLRAVVEQVTATLDVALYLHCLPRSLMHDWVRHHRGDDKAAAYTDLPEIGTPDDEVTTVIDTEIHLAVREAAIAVHRSQRSPFDGLPEALRRAFLCREHLIRVRPAWTGGPTETQLAGARPPGRPEHGDPAQHGHTARCWWHPLAARWTCSTVPAASLAASR